VEAEARVEFSLPARAENVPLVRHALAGLANALDMEASAIADLKTVVTEACTNVVVHAYDPDTVGPMEVEAWPEDGRMVVSVRDRGHGIRPLADVERQSLRLGLALIAALTESFEVRGEVEKGTEVVMKVPISANGSSHKEPPAAAPERADEMRIDIGVGAALAPVLSRVISMFAARADFSVDRLSDAVLLSDAISAGGAAGFPNGTAHIAVSEHDGSFEVRVGPLVDGGGQRLLDGLRIPDLGGSLETLADEVRVDSSEAGEMLVVRIAGEAARV
jgi:anti-sigma regulatory factor (Ser/Thr protein kinase)